MHMQLAGRHAAKPADEASDQSAVQERAGKIVARLGERLQHVGADWRLIGPSPYHREQLLQPAQILQVAQLPDLSVHARPSRRPVTSEPACTPAAATIASANAGAIPSGRRTASTRKKDANANRPRSRPRNTLTAGSRPWSRCANVARTAPYSGKGASSPASRGPSSGAAEVSATTNAVATTMRAGISHRGKSRCSAVVSDRRGIRKSAITSTTATTARNASPGIRSGLRVMVAAEKAAVAASIEAIQVERWAVHAQARRNAACVTAPGMMSR